MRTRPAPRRGLVDDHQKAAHRHDEQQGAPDVERPTGTATGGGYDVGTQDDERNSDRDVDQEGGSPAEVVVQQPANHRTELQAQRDGGADDAKDLPALIPGKDRDGQDAAISRDAGGADALDDARDKHRLERGHQRQQAGAAAEQDHAGQEHVLASEAVAQMPGRQQHTDERNRVRQLDPVFLVQVQVKLRGKNGIEHVGDAGVQRVHEHADAHDAQHHPPLEPRQLRRRRLRRESLRHAHPALKFTRKPSARVFL